MVRKIRSDVKRGARDPEVTLSLVSVAIRASASSDDGGGRRSATEYVEVEGRKWPLPHGLMTWIVIGGVVGLLLLSGIVSAAVESWRSAR